MKNSFHGFVVTCVAMLTFINVAIAQDKNAAIEANINQLIKKMTLEEKIAMLHFYLVQWQHL
jgi:hypothetical protein